MEKTLVTLDEFAEESGIPAGTLRYWKHMGQGPSWQRIGRRLYARRADLDAWLAAQFDDADKAS